MLARRITTALALLAILAAAVWAGGAVLAEVLALVVGIALYEWLRLAGHGRVTAAVAAVLFAVGLLASELSGRRLDAYESTLIFGAAVALWLGLTALVLSAAQRPVRIGRVAATALGFALLGAAWFAVLALLQHGLIWLLSVLAVVWIADIAAYVSGRACGRRKLAPLISPGKTWEGVLGAAAAVLVAALAAGAWLPHRMFSTDLTAQAGLVGALLVLLALVALSIVGDLFESLLKRQAGVKDSGTLLPGHGGVLDRIDALLPVLPTAALIQHWLS
jgi:phosphatidate cytidylyltransferase